MLTVRSDRHTYIRLSCIGYICEWYEQSIVRIASPWYEMSIVRIVQTPCKALLSMCSSWSSAISSTWPLPLSFVIVLGTVSTRECRVPRLTSSCCDISSTCQSSSTSFGDTHRDTVTVSEDSHVASVSGSDRRSTDSEKPKQFHEISRDCGVTPRHLGGLEPDSADSSLMLPPESTVWFLIANRLTKKSRQ